MATISMQDLIKDAGTNVTVTLTSHSESQQTRKTRVGERPGRSIEETKALVKKCLEESGRAMTVAEICIYLERVQTPHIRNILKTMADAGEIVEQADLARSRMVRFWYSLP